MKLSKLKTLSLLGISLLLAACASKQPSEFEYFPGNESQLYSAAITLIQTEDLQKADKYLNQLSIQYPFGEYKDEVEVMRFYTYFAQNKLDLALAAIDTYLKNEEGKNKYSDYAVYLRGVTNLRLGNNTIQDLLKINQTTRNTSRKHDALVDFYTYLHSFPSTSPYYADASRFVKHAEYLIASFEYAVAEFYYEKGKYLSAANRAAVVYSNFPKSAVAYDAYLLASNSYKALGFKEKALDLQGNAEFIKPTPEERNTPVNVPVVESFLPAFANAFIQKK